MYHPHTPPPLGMAERRKGLRREEDAERDTIVEHSVEGAWLVNKLIKWGKLAAAGAAILVLTNGLLSALNIRMIGTSSDVRELRAEMAKGDTVLSARINTANQQIEIIRRTQDSMVTLMTQMNNRMERFELVYCLTVAPLSNRRLPPICEGK